MSNFTFFKRFRMEIDLRQPRPRPGLRVGLWFVPWADHLLESFARVKSDCFANELDSLVFPCLGSEPGCRQLMTAIRARPGFCAGATWLVAGPDGYVATVQGVIDANGFGAVQNLGVVPEYRGQGIGRATLLQALEGFAAAGAQRALLEATARNESAVRMYRDLGFRAARTIYRQVHTPVPVGVGL